MLIHYLFCMVLDLNVNNSTTKLLENRGPFYTFLKHTPFVLLSMLSKEDISKINVSRI